MLLVLTRRRRRSISPHRARRPPLTAGYEPPRAVDSSLSSCCSTPAVACCSSSAPPPSAPARRLALLFQLGASLSCSSDAKVRDRPPSVACYSSVFLVLSVAFVRNCPLERSRCPLLLQFVLLNSAPPTAGESSPTSCCSTQPCPLQLQFVRTSPLPVSFLPCHQQQLAKVRRPPRVASDFSLFPVLVQNDDDFAPTLSEISAKR